MPIKLTDQILKDVKAAYDEGWGERKISKNLNLSRNTVLHAMKELGIYGVGRRPKKIPQTKKCKTCGEVKNIDQFFLHKREKGGDYYSAHCLECDKKINSFRNASPKYKNKRKEYRQNNKDKLNKAYNDKIKNEPVFRLRKIVSGSITKQLKLQNSSKDKSCLLSLDYTIEELRNHLQAQFEPWMTWENHGPYYKNSWKDDDSSTWTWQIDHIIPQSDLPYINMDEDNFKKAWSLNNLRPLSAKINCTEGGNKTRHKINK